MFVNYDDKPKVPPKGLTGRFLAVDEVVEASDLHSYNPYDEMNANWKISLMEAGIKLKRSCITVFFRSSDSYKTDKIGYYVPPKREIDLTTFNEGFLARAPKGLSGRFLKKGEIVKENDLMDYGGYNSPEIPQKPPRWRKVLSKGYDSICEGWHFRAYQKYLIDANGYYLKPSDDKTFIVDAAPEPVKVVKKITHKAILHNVY